MPNDRIDGSSWQRGWTFDPQSGDEKASGSWQSSVGQAGQPPAKQEQQPAAAGTERKASKAAPPKDGPWPPGAKPYTGPDIGVPRENLRYVNGQIYMRAPHTMNVAELFGLQDKAGIKHTTYAAEREKILKEYPGHTVFSKDRVFRLDVIPNPKSLSAPKYTYQWSSGSEKPVTLASGDYATTQSHNRSARPQASPNAGAPASGQRAPQSPGTQPPATQPGPTGAPPAEEPREVAAAEAKGLWEKTYGWLGDARIVAGANGANRVTFYGGWATPDGALLKNPVMNWVGTKISPRTGAVAYGLAQFFQGYKPGNDPLFTAAKTAEMGVAAGLYFNSVVNTLAKKNDPKAYSMMEKWLAGKLDGKQLNEFVDYVNKAMTGDAKLQKELTFIQKLVHGARKPGQTFAHDVVIKGFTLAIAADIANIAVKHGDMLVRAVDGDPSNNPTNAEYAAAGKDAAMSLGKHAPLLYTTIKGRQAIKGAYGLQAELAQKAAGEAERAAHFGKLAEKARQSGDVALAKQFETSKAHFETLETNTKKLSGEVLDNAKVLSSKWMRGGFAMMDAAFAIKNEMDLVKVRESVAAMQAQMDQLPATDPQRAQMAQAIKEQKYMIKSFEDSRLSNGLNVAAHVTPAAFYKDIVDLVAMVGLPNMEEYKKARVKMGLDPNDLDDPLAGMFTTTSPSIYLTEKAITRVGSELGRQTPEEILYQRKMNESFKALLSATADRVSRMAKYAAPVMFMTPPLLPLAPLYWYLNRSK